MTQDNGMDAVTNPYAELSQAQAEIKRLRAALEDIASDPVIVPGPMPSRRGIAEILKIARDALINGDKK